MRFLEHLDGDGQTIFKQPAKWGLEGIVSKRTDFAYRNGRTKSWVKIKTLVGQPCSDSRMGVGEANLFCAIRSMLARFDAGQSSTFPHISSMLK